MKEFLMILCMLAAAVFIADKVDRRVQPPCTQTKEVSQQITRPTGPVIDIVCVDGHLFAIVTSNRGLAVVELKVRQEPRTWRDRVTIP